MTVTQPTAPRSQAASSAGARGHARRVLVVVQNCPVPFDRRVWHQSRALAEAGHDVTVICPQGTTHDTEPRAEIEGVHIYRFALRSAESGLDYAREYWLSLWHVWRLVRKLSRTAPFDAVHVTNPPDVMMLAVRGQRRKGARLIFDQHDLVPELFDSRFGGSAGLGKRLLRRALIRLERMTYRLADVVIVTNESYRQIAIGRGGVALDRVHIVRNGPDLDRFLRVEPEPELKRGRAFLACYLGVMGPQDGVDKAVQSLAELRTRFGREDLHAVFIGAGDAGEDCKRLAHELGLDDRVEFVGRVPDSTVQRYLSTADVCLAPDPPSPLNDMSTMTKIMEYMAMSCPVVSFDLPETRVSAGRAAVYARGEDVTDFARLIGELLDDPERRREMAAEGRRRVEDSLSWQASRERLYAAYQQVFSRSR
jgi:glycosyltransferase involved in cell wall biosynthesis